jgi:multicomponent Na+:H+ antiporter subunit B
MNSSLLSASTVLLMPLLMVYSIHLLFSGHNMPGGGFVGGLIAAAAFALYAVAYDVRHAKDALRIPPRRLIAFGLLLAAVSGLPGLFRGLPYLTGLWSYIVLPAAGKLGTPLFFDAGVYLVVLGVTLQIVFALAEAGEEN